MKKLLSIVVMVLLGVTSMWAKQVTKTVYDGTYLPDDLGPLLIYEFGGENPNPDVLADKTRLQLNETNTKGTAYVQFTSLEYTIINSYKFSTGRNGKTTFSSPSYAINDGGFVDAPDDKDYNTEVSGENTDNTFKVATKSVKTLIGSYYYCRLKNFELNVVIPEVFDRSIQTTELEALSNSDLVANTISRKGSVPFLVKDPIDMSSPRTYFDATIPSSSSTGEKWEVLETGWVCVPNDEANRTFYKINDTEPGTYIVAVPVQYTATTKQRGNFEATVKLSSRNTYDNSEDEQKVIIAVAEKQNYAIDWGNSWEDDGEITLYKGNSYPRVGEGGYLANTAELELGTPSIENINPADPSATIVSFDATTAAMTLHEEGTVKLTYTQPATDTHNEKILTLTVHVVKRTPEFTLNYDEKDGDTYVFYVNHDYTPFVISSNTNFADYPITITHNNAADNQFISFEAEDATTHSVPRENIQISVHQEEGDLWYEGNATYTIAIREDPIHVGTLCRRTLTELFNDANFTIEKRYSARLDATGTKITIGTTAGGSNGGYVIFHFTGTPDALEWTYENTNGNNNTWTVEQSATNDEGSYVALGAGNTFNADSRYLKITISGTQSQGNITSLCITEKVGATIVPKPIDVILSNGVMHDAKFTVNVFNLTEMRLRLSGTNVDEFELVRDGKTYDATTKSITLDYTDGLGIDKADVAVPVELRYKGDIASAVGKVCVVNLENLAGDALYDAANASIKEIASTGGVPNVIVATTSEETGIYTGTEIFDATHTTYKAYPYYQKKQIDVSSAFGHDGAPLFDRLYIFGLTTSAEALTHKTVEGHKITIPTSAAGSNAITPCYIYEKEGSGYTLKHTVDNMNAADKDAYFNITASGQKVYFTGYCPYATSSYGTGNYGAVCFTGAASSRVDIYLDNLYLTARSHTADGRTRETSSDTIVCNLNTSGITYIEATGAAFAFKTTNTNTSTPFQPTIHLIGDNELEGGKGAVKASILTLSKAAGLHSSPIHIIPTADNQCTTLTIDDKWPINASGTTEHTNGILDIAPAGDGRPCVDLGNDRSTLNINGGQIYVKNSLPSSTSYLCTFAIGYRQYSQSYTLAGITATITLTGIGNDQAGGNVNFNDGTINCRPLTDANMTKFGAYYRGKTSMKCPKNTKINGGTYNCDIWACSAAANLGASPTNRWGNALVTMSVPVVSTPEEPYYLAEIDFTTYPGWLICNLSSHADYGLTLNQYYTKVGGEYGCKSMRSVPATKDAADPDSVTLMIPYQFTDKEALSDISVNNWALCMPMMTVDGAGELSFGGPTTVQSDETSKTNYLLHAMLDSYTTNLEDYTIPTSVGLGNVKLTMDPDVSYEVIQNEEAYQVEKEQYLVQAIRGDEWILFSPPFDVTDVYVIEAYPEEELVELAVDNMDEAYILQAKAAVDLFFYVVYDIVISNTSANFDNLYQKWIEDSNLKKGAGKQKLKHFTGANYDANYYLQRSSGIWKWDGENFTTDWQYLPTTPETVVHGGNVYNVVMKKGEVYSMNFPYMYYGYRDEGNWDYWTGKYVIFVGKGPQTIEGKDYQTNTVLRAMEAAPGSAEIRMNSTLAALEVSNMGAYYLDLDDEGTQTFMSNPDDSEPVEVTPTSGFILVADPSANAQRIKSISLVTGDVTYEDSDDTTTSIPTIAGNNKMLVYTMNGGVGIVPVVEQQVSIYNAAGQLVTSQYLTAETTISLPAGIYLICGENEMAKAVVR